MNNSATTQILENLSLSPADWQVLKHNTRVLVATHTSQPHILKVYIGHSSKERLKSLFGYSRDRRARIGTQLLADITIATPSIHQSGRSQHYCYVVMDKVQGEGVFDYLDLHPQLDCAVKSQLFHNLGKLTATLHKHGIVHGDMRPNNVLISEDDIEQLCLIDNDRTRKPWLRKREFIRNLMQMMMIPDSYISLADRDAFFAAYGEARQLKADTLQMLRSAAMTKVYWRFQHEGLPHPDHYKAS